MSDRPEGVNREWEAAWKRIKNDVAEIVWLALQSPNGECYCNRNPDSGMLCYAHSRQTVVDECLATLRSHIESLTELAEKAHEEVLDRQRTIQTLIDQIRWRNADLASAKAASERDAAVVEAATALVYVCTDHDKEVCEGYHDAPQGCDKCQMKRLADALAARGGDE